MPSQKRNNICLLYGVVYVELFINVCRIDASLYRCQSFGLTLNRTPKYRVFTPHNTPLGITTKSFLQICQRYKRYEES